MEVSSRAIGVDQPSRSSKEAAQGVAPRRTAPLPGGSPMATQMRLIVQQCEASTRPQPHSAPADRHWLIAARAASQWARALRSYRGRSAFESTSTTTWGSSPRASTSTWAPRCGPTLIARAPGQMVTTDGDPIDPAGQGVLFYLYSHDLPALRQQLLASGSPSARSRTETLDRLSRCS